MSISERLIAAREQRGWTKAELKRAARIKAASTITELENGTILHSPQLPAIAKALGIDALWLQTGKGKPVQGHQAVSLDAEEQAIVEFYRAASPDLRAAMLRMVCHESEMP